VIPISERFVRSWNIGLHCVFLVSIKTGERPRVSLPDDLIARWSSRKNVDQNEAYDQRPVQEVVDQARQIVEKTAAAVDGRETGEMASLRREVPWVIVSGSNMCGSG
jgi:hypothetical protein